MKKTLLTIALSTLAFTNIQAKDIDGHKVFQKNCASCHVEFMEKKEVLKKFKTLKAPPMNEVAFRLNENIINLDDDDDVKRQMIIVWIKNYIDAPSMEYSMCHAGAIERFGIMPSLKGQLNEAEKQAVAEWILDRYEGIAF